MGCNIDRGLARVCKHNIGGIANVFLFPFEKYMASEIITDNLILTTFPETIIYPFHAVLNGNLEQNMQVDDGGKYYNQRISLQFHGIADKFLFEKLLKRDYRLIIKDNNGVYRLIGTYNGVICDNITVDTGGNKSSFNGITADFSGKEKIEALFINELKPTGFTIF